MPGWPSPAGRSATPVPCSTRTSRSCSTSASRRPAVAGSGTCFRRTGQALVELTAFAPGPAAPPPAAALAGYLPGGYEILRTESAVLPLRTRRPRRCWGRVVRIGARAGLVKASTGYGYQRIQRDSAAIATSLVRYGHPFARPPARRRYRLLDAVLLDVLRRDPAELERAFAGLFGTNPVARVLRFLDEDTGPVDELRLIAALPPVPYLRAATRLALRRAVERRPR